MSLILVRGTNGLFIEIEYAREGEQLEENMMIPFFLFVLIPL